MCRITDMLEDVERDLNKSRGDDENQLLQRRYVLRKRFEAWGREQYDLGHSDGMRDVHDTQREAKRRADMAAGQETQLQEGNDNA